VKLTVADKLGYFQFINLSLTMFQLWKLLPNPFINKPPITLLELKFISYIGSLHYIKTCRVAWRSYMSHVIQQSNEKSFNKGATHGEW